MIVPKLKLTGLALFLLAGLTAGRAATILYTQPPTVAPAAYSAWESESTADGVNARTYDSFTLTSAAEIGVVIWEGIYVDQSNVSDNPAPANTTSFEISFWSDNGGQPGTMLAVSTVAASAVHAIALPERSFALSDGDVKVSQFAYNATLPSTFTAAAGRKYWISILSNSTSLEPVWGWTSSTGGDATTIQDFDGSRYTRSGGRAFALESAALPKVTVAATASLANLATRKAGIFHFKISQPQSSPIVIHYTLKGSAVNGEDYDRLTGLVKIKPNTTTATVKIVPKGMLEGAPSKKVKLMLEANSDYAIGTAGGVTVTIEK